MRVVGLPTQRSFLKRFEIFADVGPGLQPKYGDENEDAVADHEERRERHGDDKPEAALCHGCDPGLHRGVVFAGLASDLEDLVLDRFHGESPQKEREDNQGGVNNNTSNLPEIHDIPFYRGPSIILILKYIITKKC